MEPEEVILVSIYLPKSLHKDVKIQSARLGIPMSTLFKNVMDAYLEKYRLKQGEKE